VRGHDQHLIPNEHLQKLLIYCKI